MNSTSGKHADSPATRGGFTLIELLVVIAIITNYAASEFGGGYWGAW